MTSKYEAEEFVGYRNGHLVALKFTHKKTSKGLNVGHFLCRCDCGKEVLVGCSDLVVRKNRTSCGCATGGYKHGEATTRFYKVWLGMIQRCYLKSHTSYHHYGESGITVCDSWREDYISFKKDMSDGYNDSLTLDRIDNSKGYFKENCRWADHGVQTHNRNKLKNCKLKTIGTKLNGSRYQTSIKANGIYEYLGAYATEEDAAKAYDEASFKYFGDRPNKDAGLI